jgi:hypothetical protein
MGQLGHQEDKNNLEIPGMSVKTNKFSWEEEDRIDEQSTAHRLPNK